LSGIYKNGLVYANSRVKNKREDKEKLSDYCASKIIKYPNVLVSGANNQDAVMRDELAKVNAQQILSKKLGLNDLGQNAVCWAIDNNPFFAYRKLKHYLPTLPSMDLFIARDLTDIKIEVRGTETRLDGLTQKEKQDIASYISRKVV